MGSAPNAPGSDSRRSAGRKASSIGAALCLFALAACEMQREFVITSQPEGARVRMDGDLIGETPLRLPFDDYGTRRFTLYLDGHLTSSRVVEVDPPWYNHFPLDIVSEILLPFGWRDLREVHFELVEGTGRIPPPDLASVRRRAESMRRAGPEGPTLPSEDPERPRP